LSWFTGRRMSGVFSEEPNAFAAKCRCRLCIDRLWVQRGWFFVHPGILASYFSSGLKHFKFLVVGEFKSSILTFKCPCIANMFAEYNQQDTTFVNLFISVRRSTCFRRFFRPSSGVQNCVYVRYLWDQDCYLLLVAGSSNGLTSTWRCMCSFELLMMDGKTVWNM